MKFTGQILTLAFFLINSTVWANTSEPPRFDAGFNQEQVEIFSGDAAEYSNFESNFNEQHSEVQWDNNAQSDMIMMSGRPGPGGGGGGTGPGEAVPIDTHVYALMIVALLFIVFYTRQTTAQKTN